MQAHVFSAAPSLWGLLSWFVLLKSLPLDMFAHLDLSCHAFLYQILHIHSKISSCMCLPMELLVFKSSSAELIIFSSHPRKISITCFLYRILSSFGLTRQTAGCPDYCTYTDTFCSKHLTEVKVTNLPQILI